MLHLLEFNLNLANSNFLNVSNYVSFILWQGSLNKFQQNLFSSFEVSQINISIVDVEKALAV